VIQRHKCFDTVDATLRKHNTRIVVDPIHPNVLFVATEKIRRLRDGKPAFKALAAFCPFCGERLELSEEVTDEYPRVKVK
jgi:hypothetical protein